MQKREIKLGHMLERLIEDHGYSRNRKKILTGLDISAAALSQYVRDQTRPSFSKLTGLADFFGVSLDYLVYGESARGGQDAASEPTLRFVDFALSEVQARTSRHSAIVARMGRVLADRVDEVGKELASSPAVLGAGLAQEEEMLRLEEYCLQADIFSLDLAFDVIPVKGGVAAGRFLDVVARNIQGGIKYRFLIPNEKTFVRDSTVAELRGLLAEKAGGDQVHENCSIRRSSTPLMAGAVLYQLDVEAMQAKEPALYAQFSPYIDTDRWFGCIIRPNQDSNSDMVFDAAHLARAKISFGMIWAAGRAA